MGETVAMGESAGNADLAQLLAEVAAGLPGAESRLAARLRPELRALLSQRLAGPGAASVADAGALVQRHWQQLTEAEASAGTRGADAIDGGDTKNATGKKGKTSRKAVTSAKPRKGAKGGKGVGVTAAPGLLFLPYVEQAAVVMEGLVRDLAVRTAPDGPAMTTLNALRALDALAELDPPLAHTARLRWFAGMEHEAIAGLLREDETEVRHRWLKACAFVMAASKGSAIPSP